MGKASDRTGLEPIALALVVCDHVHIDPISFRRTTLGAFHETESPHFPMSFPVIAVYAAMTDGRGLMPITIRLVDVDEDDAPTWSDTYEVDFKNPQEVYELSMEVRDTPFEKPGIYRLQLLADGATIMERSVSVYEAPAQE